MSNLDLLRALAEMPERQFGDGTYEVTHSNELDRILALPRRTPPDDETQAAMAEAMTGRLRRDNPACQCARLRPEVVARGQNPCLTAFRPLQGWYLYEAAREGGAAGFMPVGSGKTALDIFLAMVVPGCRYAVLLIRPNEQEQFKKDFAAWSQHFRTPNLMGGPGPFSEGVPTLEVFPYSKLQRPENAFWFKERNPDVVISDEAQKLKDRSATSTGRFLDFFAEVPNARFFCHSGSLTTRGLGDCGHLLALALRDGSPLPQSPSVLESWAEAVDPPIRGAPAKPGALLKLCQPGQDVRAGLSARIVETSGIISTTDLSVDAKLVLKELGVECPAHLEEMIEQVQATETRPDGEVLEGESVQLEVAACVSQLACGFYYKFFYPRGEPEALIDKWFDRRQAWNREVRVQRMKRIIGMDSPYLIRLAAERGLAGYKGPLPVWRSETLAGWKAIEDKVQPETHPVWVDDYLVKACAEWARSGPPGIIWYTLDAFGEALAKATRLPWYGDQASGVRNLNATPAMQKAREGMLALGGWRGTPGDWIQIEMGERPIIASLRAMGTGKNLQSFWRQLWPNPVADGGAVEQGLGRCHRAGQPRDVVEAYFCRHTEVHRDALNTATEYAKYAQELERAPKRLMFAERPWKAERAGRFRWSDVPLDELNRP